MKTYKQTPHVWHSLPSLTSTHRQICERFYRYEKADRAGVALRTLQQTLFEILRDFDEDV